MRALEYVYKIISSPRGLFPPRRHSSSSTNCFEVCCALQSTRLGEDRGSCQRKHLANTLLCVIPIFLLAVLGFLDRFFYKQNEMFCLNGVLPRWSRCPQLETAGDLSYAQILDQPFTYLAQGKQSFVFKSEDEKWVIKLFRLPRYVKVGSLKGKKASLAGLEKMFESFQLSCEALRQETGVVYAHLRPTTSLRKKIELIDPYLHHYRIDLDTLPFVIQPVGDDFFTVLRGLDEKGAKDLIRKTVLLFSSLFDKGVVDQDPIFDKNFGVYEGEPFIMDVGQLEPLSERLSRHDYLLQMTNSLDIYLREHAPHLYGFYKNLLQ